ncbi:MAG: redoxin domain-containing protein [Burkholderiaceae bacterium]|nr:redoxin domain-containing protein [Burkholderiaceae bacterium]
MNSTAPPAPPWHITEWLNSASPLSLEGLRGKVIMLEVFQMLCPGCVSHGLPQAQRVAEQFDPAEVAVLGLHSVFEHHAVMTPAALRAFVHEQRLRFPIGIDEPDGREEMPLTMKAYQMQGTPTLILIDKQGRLRLQRFGAVSDLYLGAGIAQLVCESGLPIDRSAPLSEVADAGCNETGCAPPVR